MASSTLVKDVLYRASVALLDSAPQFTRWTELELVMAYNDGLRAIAKYLPSAASEIVMLKLTAGQTRQSIAAIPAANLIMADLTSPPAVTRGTLLLDVIRNMGSTGYLPGAPIRVIGREVQDNIDTTWHVTYGNGSVDHYMFDPRQPTVFYVTPRVSASVATWVEALLAVDPVEAPMSGIPRYAASGSDGTVISINDQYVDDLLNYILARANMKDSEFANADKAAFHAQAFTASINSQAQVLTGSNPNLSFLPFTPSMPGSAR